MVFKVRFLVSVGWIVYHPQVIYMTYLLTYYCNCVKVFSESPLVVNSVGRVVNMSLSNPIGPSELSR